MIFLRLMSALSLILPLDILIIPDDIHSKQLLMQYIPCLQVRNAQRFPDVRVIEENLQNVKITGCQRKGGGSDTFVSVG